MTSIVLSAPAKINLYLEVTARRADGYHNIESVMQTVDLFDTLTLTRRERDGQGIVISCDDACVPTGEGNLIHRAASLMFDTLNARERDITFSLEKRIPMAAGLGGGSSDAAAALIGVNKLYGDKMSTDELCSLGAKIGADVPFCIRQGIALTRGIGDIHLPCPKLPDCFIVLACAGEGVSTPWAYGCLDDMYDYDKRNVSSEAFVAALGSADITAVAREMTNIFELAVLPQRAVAREIRDTLTERGALKAMMSGSGPSVFGIFLNESDARGASTALTERGIIAHITKPYYPAL